MTADWVSERHVVFALAIPTTADWVPERAASLERLKAQLGHRPVYYREFRDREPNWSWSGKMWEWGLSTGATHLVQLQDDVIVSDCFWQTLRRMVEALEEDAIIGLESVLDIGRPWYCTGDGLIGVGCVIPREPLGYLLDFRRALRPGAIEALNEDQLIGLYAHVAGRDIWHPVPTIIDHDVDIVSTYGNDHHTHRRPVKSAVRGDALPESWAPVRPTPRVPLVYGATPRLARLHMPAYSYERYLRESR